MDGMRKIRKKKIWKWLCASVLFAVIIYFDPEQKYSMPAWFNPMAFEIFVYAFVVSINMTVINIIGYVGLFYNIRMAFKHHKLLPAIACSVSPLTVIVTSFVLMLQLTLTMLTYRVPFLIDELERLFKYGAISKTLFCLVAFCCFYAFNVWQSRGR